MRQLPNSLIITVTAVAVATCCTRISVAPSCPQDLGVGDSADIPANESDEGAIPTFDWSVDPGNAGTFTNADKPVTTFTAAQAGPATIRLQASDGLFLATAQCRVEIGTGGVRVSLAFAPRNPVADDEVTLTCTSTGGVPATEFTIDQVEGPEVTLEPVSPGVVAFTADSTGQYRFSCVGSGGTLSSDPDVVPLTVRDVKAP